MFMDWPKADAWVLAALRPAGERPVRLGHLFAAMDHVMHALPVWDELRGALERLAALGFVATGADTVNVTAAGVGLIPSSVRAPLDQVKLLEAALNEHGQPDPLAPINVSESAFRAAMAAYVAPMKKLS
jgi:hypothetical protein